MVMRLNQVAAEFRKVSNKQMAETTKRTIRENVSINAQLAKMSDKTLELIQENDELRTKEKKMNLFMLEFLWLLTGTNLFINDLSVSIPDQTITIELSNLHGGETIVTLDFSLQEKIILICYDLSLIDRCEDLLLEDVQERLQSLNCLEGVTVIEEVNSKNFFAPPTV